jgi:hypothetical protein
MNSRSNPSQGLEPGGHAGLPVLVVFLALPRYFQPGIGTTGLKG